MNLSDFGRHHHGSRPTRLRDEFVERARPAPRQWAVIQDGVYQPCQRVCPRLPAGAYIGSLDPDGSLRVLAHELRTDQLLDFPGSTAAVVIQEIERFWRLHERYRYMGYRHSRGYLFYGPQGSGKSSLALQIVVQHVKRGNVAFFCKSPHVLVCLMEVFRKIEPDRPVVCVFEDLDGIIAEDDDPKLLNWLDGFFGVDHVVNVATTNYPELLDPRVVCRPRRFDRVVKIDWPPDELRRTYLRGKLPELESPMLDDWVMKTSGLSIAALAELVISVSCLETPFEEALAVLRAIEGKAPSSEEFVHRQSMGFAANGT